MSDTNANNQSGLVGNVPSPRNVAIFTGVVLIVAAFVLFWVQERSVIRTCLELTGQNYNICFGEMNVTFDGNFETQLNRILKKNASSNGIYYGLLAALVGGVAALLCVIALPADQLQFTGRFERNGGQIRVGGAVGIFLLFSLAGGWLAYSNTPGAEREVLKDQAMVALLGAQERLKDDLENLEQELKNRSQQHADLINNLADNTDDFALSILNMGYFSRMNGMFEIDCQNQQTERQREFLKVNVPSVSAGSVQFDNGLFGIPLDNLLKSTKPSSRDEWEPNTNPVSELRIELSNAQKRYIKPTLAETNFSILINKTTPRSREVRMHTKIIAKNIADYCRSDNAATAPVPSSLEADPLAAPGGS